MSDAVEKLAGITLTGNIVPMTWVKHITKSNGKPHLLAIMILSDILYWYRPKEIREQAFGGVVKYEKKFRGEYLQRSYHYYAKIFNSSKETIKEAIVRLEQLGFIERIVMNVEIENNGFVRTIPNVLYLKLNVDKVLEITKSVPIVEPEIKDNGDETEYIYMDADGVSGGNIPLQIHRFNKENNIYNNNNINDDLQLANVNDDNISLRETIANDIKLITGRGALSWFEVSEFERLYKSYGTEKVRDALKKAKVQNKFSLAYVEGILKGNGEKKAKAKEPSRKLSRKEKVDEMINRMLSRHKESKNDG